MKKTIKYVAPWLSAAAIGAAIALGPIASAAPATAAVSQNAFIADPAPGPGTGPDPLVPYGPNPQIPSDLGYYNPILPDDSGTTNPAGGVDLPG